MAIVVISIKGLRVDFQDYTTGRSRLERLFRHLNYVRARMKRILTFLICFLPFLAMAQENNVARVSALVNGKLLLNGKATNLLTLESEFQRVQKKEGSIWYYRENPQAEPSPNAMEVIKLVVQYGLPISMSSCSFSPRCSPPSQGE